MGSKPVIACEPRHPVTELGDYPAEYQIVQSSVSRLVGELDDRVLTEPLRTLKTEAAAGRAVHQFRQYREANDENLTFPRLKLFREPFLIYRL